MDYLGYNEVNYNPNENCLLLGEISEFFTAPLIPKIVIVGLNLNDDPSLHLFKDGLVKALTNLFVVEFAEQVAFIALLVIIVTFLVFPCS